MGPVHFVVPLRQVLFRAQVAAGKEGLQAEVHEDGAGRGTRRGEDSGEEWENQGGGLNAVEQVRVGPCMSV